MKVIKKKANKVLELKKKWTGQLPTAKRFLSLKIGPAHFVFML